MTDPNPSDKNGRTLLHAAAEKGLTETVEEILDVLKEVNGDVNPADKDDYRPMSWAAYNGHVDVVKMIGNAVLLDRDKRNSVLEFRQAQDMQKFGKHNEDLQKYLRTEIEKLDAKEETTDPTPETDMDKQCQLCSKAGTELCNVKPPHCFCYPNFKGEYCDKCQDGFYFWDKCTG